MLPCAPLPSLPAAAAWLLSAAAMPAAPATGPADTEDVGVVTEKQADPTMFPDPRKFARGVFAEGALGTGIPVGPTSGLLSPSFGASVRLGYEIRRWVALQAQATGLTGYYDDGILTREIFQQFAYTGELRFGVPFRRFVIGVEGGAGLYHLTSNLLQVGGVTQSPSRIGLAWDAALFFDIHSLSRHFSGGLLAGFVGTPALGNAGTVLVQLYLRYTL